MATNHSPDIDDDQDDFFNEVYGKEYTGPPRLSSNNAPDKVKANKRSLVNDQSDEEDEPRDPNAVPTDFTSREAKVWEAKAKATERNWKKRKEEEMICKICGEVGHFTQGCPSTLGANRKSADFFERVPARDKHVRALFSENVILRIEKDVGCKIKMDEKFLIVSGKDRLILAKGVDAVHKLIQDEDKSKRKGSTSSQKSRSRSPDGSSSGSQLRRSESQRSYSSPRNASQFKNKGFNQEKVVEDNLREDLQKLSRGSAQAFGNDGAKRRPMHPKSSSHPAFAGDTFNSYDGHNRDIGMPKTDSRDAEMRRVDSRSGNNLDFPSYPQTLEELEMEFKKEVADIGRIHDKEEDEENYRHRECIRELGENYMKKLSVMRGLHTKQWEEFLQIDIQRQHRARQPLPTTGYNAYDQPNFSNFDRYSGNTQYAGTSLAMDQRSRYQYPGENYSAPRPHEAYGEFQHQRHEDFGKAYGRY